MVPVIDGRICENESLLRIPGYSDEREYFVSLST